MSDLISRDAALQCFGDVHPLDYNANAVMSKINKLPAVKIEEMKRKIKEHNEFSRDEIDEMYMQDILEIIDEYCGVIEADEAESVK